MRYLALNIVNKRKELFMKLGSPTRLNQVLGEFGTKQVMISTYYSPPVAAQIAVGARDYYDWEKTNLSFEEAVEQAKKNEEGIIQVLRSSL